MRKKPLASRFTSAMQVFVVLGLATILTFRFTSFESIASLRQQPGHSTAERPLWTGPEGVPLPFTAEEEIKSFLGTAEVRELEKIGEGITGARRAMLEKDTIRMRAVFRTVDIRKNRMDSQPSGGVRDYHLYECAAYELSRMLGLDLVPPTVQRTIGPEKGTLQAWIENAMMEKNRIARGLEPPDPGAWKRQMQIMDIFDNLVFNDDRHLGNILVDGNWKVWLIDHTRAFRTYVHLRNEKKIVFCDRALWDNLRKMNQQELKERLSPFLTKEEIRTLEKRRKLLIEYIQKLIEKRGRQDVILD